jgi:hypothetical protein
LVAETKPTPRLVTPAKTGPMPAVVRMSSPEYRLPATLNTEMAISVTPM